MYDMISETHMFRMQVNRDFRLLFQMINESLLIVTTGVQSGTKRHLGALLAAFSCILSFLCRFSASVSPAFTPRKPALFNTVRTNAAAAAVIFS